VDDVEGRPDVRVRAPQGLAIPHGDPVSAEDVKFSFDRYKGGGATPLKCAVAAVEIVDAQRSGSRMKQPCPTS